MITLEPGAVPLEQWRAIYRGADARLDPACRPAVQRGAETIARIAARDTAVYGVNTGFGLLASIRIEPADLDAVEMGAQQRAVYESIRLAMHARVREAIAAPSAVRARSCERRSSTLSAPPMK